MKPLRKIDCYGQLTLVILIILSIPFLYGAGFLIGIFILGCWQVLSAIANTSCFISAGLTKPIYRYWAFCISDLILLFGSYNLGMTGDSLVISLMLLITFAGAVAIAAYYWWIYFRFIEFLSLRSELDGLTKSKH